MHSKGDQRMSWRAQSRSKDAKTPSVAGGRSRKPKPALCGIQPYPSRQMRCTSCAPSPAPPNGEYLPKPVDPL